VKCIIHNDGDRRRFIDFILKVDLSKPFSAIFEPVKKQRTPPQNRLFHMHMALLEDETGTSREVWKEYYKEMFLEVYTDTCFGKTVRTVRGTSDLNTKEFAEFIDKYREHAMAEGYYLPLPDEMGWEEFYQKYKDDRKTR
jgi:hypothetical protein